MRIRTGYSFKHAYGNLSQVMDVLVEKEFQSAPICDRNSTFAFTGWNELAKKHNKKPVFGVELAVCRNPSENKKVFDYWSFFSISEIEKINELYHSATCNGVIPYLTYEQAKNADGVIKIANEISDISLLNGDCENLYFPLSPSLGLSQYMEAKEKGIPFILTNDNVYPSLEYEDVYHVVSGKNYIGDIYERGILSIKELVGYMIDMGFSAEAIFSSKKNYRLCSDMCNAQLKKGRLVSPKKEKTIREMCLEYAEKNGIKLNEEYLKRLDYEIEIIEKKNFSDYFYILADIVCWARERMLVGPARGSSCGSLVCYLLGITTIDPIQNGLIFERFIDLNREDLPDIDVDFPDVCREKVFNRLKEVYGESHVAKIGAVSFYKPKSAINEVGIAIGCPRWECASFTDALEKHQPGDGFTGHALEVAWGTDHGKKFLEKYPGMILASMLEGHPRHATTHAAGVIITDQPVACYVGVDAQTNTAMVDKYDAEKMGLLKLDSLGLTQLSILQRVLGRVGENLSFFDKIPLDYQQAFEILNQKKYAGVFQFMGSALQGVANQITTNCLDDIVAMTALARPGPMGAGGTQAWVDRRIGKARVKYPHDCLKKYLEPTLGIVIFQEQVMEIGKEIGGLSWEDVTQLRKAMSKSLGKEYMAPYGDKFKAGALRFGFTGEAVDKFWDDLCSYGAWSFNKSHSVAYGRISYWCMYLKCLFPHEFYASTLDFTTDTQEKIKILREMESCGIKYRPVNTKSSTDRWEIDSGVLVGPLNGIVGLGPKGVETMLASRAGTGTLQPKMEKMLQTPVTDIDTLWPIHDRVRLIVPDLRDIGIVTKPKSVVDVQLGMKDVVVIGVFDRINPKNLNHEPYLSKRNGEILKNNFMKLNLLIRDDTGELLAMVGEKDYEKIAVPIIDRGGVGKALYAVKGNIMFGFMMMFINKVKYIGEM